jgi:protein FRG1
MDRMSIQMIHFSKIGWVQIDEIDEIRGPISITTNNTILSANDQHKVVFIPLQQPSASFEPEHVSQVLTARTVMDSQKLLFKSAFERFLGCDRFGQVHCDNEAAGPAEEWIVEVNADKMFAFKNMHGTYLSLSQNTNSTKSHFLARSDSSEPHWMRLYCQAEAKRVLKKKQKQVEQQEQAGTATYEYDQLKKFHAFGARELEKLDVSLGSLIAARKTGKFNEELLDRRAKLKSDKVRRFQ